MTINVQTAEALLNKHGDALKEMSDREMETLAAIAAIFDKKKINGSEADKILGVLSVASASVPRNTNSSPTNVSARIQLIKDNKQKGLLALIMRTMQELDMRHSEVVEVIRLMEDILGLDSDKLKELKDIL